MKCRLLYQRNILPVLVLKVKYTNIYTSPLCSLGQMIVGSDFENFSNSQNLCFFKSDKSQ